MKKGKFIVLEGLDGCGKSTISSELQKKYNAILVNAIPDEIKRWLKIIGNTKLPEATFSYFTVCNFLNSIRVSEIINSGKNVIMDRYYYTTFAYHKELLKNELPDTIIKVYKELLKPDLVIFLDVSQKTRKERIMKRNGELQWYGDAISIKKDLTKTYKYLFEKLKVESYIVDNENNSIQETLNLIDEKIETVF